MKPIDLENLILAALPAHRPAGLGTGITITQLHRSLSPAHGRGPIWRSVANAVYRLERQGLVHIVGDEMVGDTSQPLFARSPAGDRAAEQSASLDPGLLKRHAQQQEETEHADD